VKTAFLAKLLAFALSSFIILPGCDMTRVFGPDVSSESESDVFMREGRSLRITGLPHNLQAHNISQVSAANAVSTVARLDAARPIRIANDEFHSTAYIPLVNNDGTAFTENGPLFVMLAIDADALTRIVVERDDEVLVNFFNGRGALDISDIPLPHNPPDGRAFLTIANLPSHVQRHNISNVAVWNQSGRIGRCADYGDVRVQVQDGSASMFIPLSYINSSEAFAGTGAFYVSFDINIDARTRITAERSDEVLVYFEGGHGTLDIDELPPPHNPSDMRTFLAITNLPAHVQRHNISNVAVWNRAGVVGRCMDYSGVSVEAWGGSASMLVPLAYADFDEIFIETGVFYVSFEINIDARTSIVVERSDGVFADFFGGNASLDVSALPPPEEQEASYLTIVGLPLNAARGNFSNVFIYNLAGRIARANYNGIAVTRGESLAEAKIPLEYINGGGSFRSSGSFIVSFAINVDAMTQIIRTFDDGVAVQISNGSGVVNLASEFGFFSGGLANPGDASPPIVRRGTAFEINGSFPEVRADAPVRRAGPIERSSLAFVYAVQRPGGVDFEYSAEVPVFDQARNGYYSGSRRALFKFVYLKDAASQYVAKTFISDPWPPFLHHAIRSDTPQALSVNGSIEGLPVVQAFSGLGNPAAAERSLAPGAYIFVLRGSGGGGGGGNNTGANRNGGQGGDGGFVAELVILGNPAAFTFFAGQGGGGAAQMTGPEQPAAGGGGGGSGASVHIPQSAALPSGYLLSAGGGGGGAGGSRSGGAGGGGAGGAAGPGGGGGGGAGGTNGSGTGAVVRRGSNGGSGGGRGAGAGGNGGAGSSMSGASGGDGAAFAGSNASGFRGDRGSGDSLTGDGGRGGNAAFADFSPASDWRNTRGANGQGANGRRDNHGLPGGAGGNNRNAARGNGASGGNGGLPQNNANSAGARGGDGSIIVYRIF